MGLIMPAKEMKIIEVVPITRQKTPELLTYRTSDNVDIGDIAWVPLRKRLIPAVVAKKTTVSEAKSDLKTHSFRVRSADKIISSNSVLKAATQAAMAASSGTSIRALDALNMIIAPRLVKALGERNDSFPAVKRTASGIPHIIQKSFTERYKLYTKAARQTSPLVIIYPNHQSLSRARSWLTKNASHLTTIEFHSKLSDARLDKQLDSLKRAEVILVTKSYIALPFLHSPTFIMEQFSSWGISASDEQRFVESFLNYYSRNIAGNFSLAETLLPLNYFDDISALPHSDEFFGKLVFTNNFSTTSILPDELLSALERSDSAPIVIVAMRKGLASMVTCSDCKKLATCTKCSSLIYFADVSNNLSFVCKKNNHVNDVGLECTHCGSWNLVPLGPGSQQIFNVVKDQYSGKRSVGHYSYSEIGQKELHSLSESSLPQIAIVTPGVLPYLGNQSAFFFMLGADAMVAIPDYAQDERLLRLIAGTAELTPHPITITYSGLQMPALFKSISNKGFPETMHEMALLRKEHLLPPFGHLVSLRPVVSTDQEGALKVLVGELSDLNPIYIEASISGPPRVIVRLGANDQSKVLQRLAKYRHHFVVEVDPIQALGSA